MKKWTLVLLIVLIFSVALDNAAIAKGKKASNRQKGETASAEVGDTSPLVPFDINAEKLPPNYKGTNIVKLYSSLAKKAPLKKKEFETTAEYERKIAEAVTDDIYAFKIEAAGTGLRGLKVHPYDADSQTLKIDLETEYLSKSTLEDYRASLIVKTLDKSSSSYIGSNAFGATRLVSKYRETQYGIALVNQQDFGKSRYDDAFSKIKTIMTSVREINMKIEIPIDKAKTLKNNIGVLLLCKPAPYKSNAIISDNQGNDLIFENYYYSGATIDSPSVESYDRKYINVEVLAIWVYDIRTGEVLLKTQLKDKEKEKQDTKT